MKVSKGQKRVLYGVGALSAALIVVQTPLATQVLTELTSAIVNQNSDYRVEIEKARIRPLLLGIQFNSVTIYASDEIKPIVQIPKGFIGFGLSSKSKYIRTVVLEEPILQAHVDELPKSKDGNDSPFELYPNIRVQSASIHLRQKNMDIQVNELYFTNKQSKAEFWTQQSIYIVQDNEPLIISPFEWNDIVFSPNNINLKDISLETNVGTLWSIIYRKMF